MVEHSASAVTIEAMAVLPDTEFVAWRNISIKGYPVGVLNAASMSPRLSRTAIIMPKPREAFSAILVIWSVAHLWRDFASLPTSEASVSKGLMGGWLELT